MFVCVAALLAAASGAPQLLHAAAPHHAAAPQLLHAAAPHHAASFHTAPLHHAVAGQTSHQSVRTGAGEVRDVQVKEICF